METTTEVLAITGTTEMETITEVLAITGTMGMETIMILVITAAAIPATIITEVAAIIQTMVEAADKITTAVALAEAHRQQPKIPALITQLKPINGLVPLEKRMPQHEGILFFTIANFL